MGNWKDQTPWAAKALCLGSCTRVDAAGGLVEKAVEKRASLALLGDADKKVEPQSGKDSNFRCFTNKMVV